MNQDLGQQSENLIAKMKHYLITTMGRASDEANIDEFYRALCYALREEIMINWLATARTHVAQRCAHALLPLHGISPGTNPHAIISPI